MTDAEKAEVAATFVGPANIVAAYGVKLKENPEITMLTVGLDKSPVPVRGEPSPDYVRYAGKLYTASGQTLSISPNLPQSLDLEKQLNLFTGTLLYTEEGKLAFTCVKEAMGRK